MDVMEYLINHNNNTTSIFRVKEQLKQVTRKKQAAWHYIKEDTILNSHHCENLKSNMLF
jgi:hypothetical protein